MSEEGRLLVAGTVPLQSLPLTLAEGKIEDACLNLYGHRIPCTQGTGALISAAAVTLKYLGLKPPLALVAGDAGRGGGSRLIYEYLIERAAEISPEVLVLHYWLPDLILMKKLCEVVERLPKKPKLIADAASMYAAKAAGLASKFDLFTPDLAELAFLADPEAFHPAYINRHLIDIETGAPKVPSLISQAYEVKGAAKVLLVKGEADYVVKEGKILEMISEPDIPAMEAIGGTGDTLTGLVSAFIYAGLELHEAAVISAKANRTAGKFAQASPATRVWEIIEQFPLVFKQYLCAWSGVCIIEDSTP